MTYQKLILVGNLGNDPEIKVNKKNMKFAKLSLATSEKYKNKSGEKIEDTQWHNLVMSGALADLAEKYLTKGSKILVEGKIKYSNKEANGVKTYYTNIWADKMSFLSSSEKKENSNNNEVENDEVDDLPF